jgi:2-polyprenyl-3-methyl-5-hydroxy-6-metoxy-1,4-benzoquinol methylase
VPKGVDSPRFSHLSSEFSQSFLYNGPLGRVVGFFSCGLFAGLLSFSARFGGANARSTAAGKAPSYEDSLCSEGFMSPVKLKTFCKKAVKAITPYGIVVLYHRVRDGKPDEQENTQENMEECETQNRLRFAELHIANNIFEGIYKSNLWGSQESRSGFGSQINATEKIRAALPELWKTYDVKTFLDVPCGDYNWMKEIDKKGMEYIGGDIVEELIVENRRKYRDKNISFRRLDITKDALPKVDMIFCKDCLQHLSDKNVLKSLKNFVNSGSTYLFATSYPLTLKNWDILDGDYRPLNLLKAPFNLPEPLYKIQERPQIGVELDKNMYLWRMNDIKAWVNGLTA